MAPPNQHEDMGGVEMAGEANGNNHPLLTELEKRVLELYDRSEMLQQEIAELRALGVLSKGQPQQASEDGIKKASEELLEAKAKYSLRSNIIESTLVANPILNAVHAGVNATVVEQDLLPLIEQRDSLSVSLTELTSKVQSTREELIKTESEHIITARRNVELATTMIALTKEADTQKKDDIVDVKARQQIDELEKAMKASRQRWRIMKGTASAIVAGSGIDWSRNPKLLEIVLDKDGEEG